MIQFADGLDVSTKKLYISALNAFKEGISIKEKKGYNNDFSDIIDSLHNAAKSETSRKGSKDLETFRDIVISEFYRYDNPNKR